MQTPNSSLLIPNSLPQEAPPVGTTDQFFQTWQALMHQLETVLSIAHQHRPNRTETREAVSIAKHLLGNVGDQIAAAIQD